MAEVTNVSANFPDLTRPDDTALLDITATKKRGLSASGFEGPHFFGKKFWNDKLFFLDELNEFGIGRDKSSNGGLLPDNQRAGATLQVAVHRGQQNGAFDALQYDGDLNPNSAKFLNQIRIKFEVDFPALYEGDPEGHRTARRSAARDVYLYERIQEMSALDQDLLNRIYGDSAFNYRLAID